MNSCVVLNSADVMLSIQVKEGQAVIIDDGLRVYEYHNQESANAGAFDQIRVFKTL